MSVLTWSYALYIGRGVNKLMHRNSRLSLHKKCALSLHVYWSPPWQPYLGPEGLFKGGIFTAIWISKLQYYNIAICSHFCIINDKHVHVWVELVMVFVLYEYCYNIFIFFFTDSYVCLRFGFSCGLTTGLLTWSPGMLMVKDLTGTRLDLSPEVLCLRLLNPTSESSARRGKIALIMWGSFALS